MRLRPKKASRVSEPEMSEKVNVDNLLGHQGLLEESHSPLPALPILTRRYTSSEFSMDGREQEQFFRTKLITKYRRVPFCPPPCSITTSRKNLTKTDSFDS
jgi:hypothetical protein